MTLRSNDSHLTTLARSTGVLYLVIIICAGFSQGVVREGLVVAGDAAATAENIKTSAGFFRIGLVTDLVAFLSDTAVSVLLFMLLVHAGKILSLAAASFRLVAHPAIAGMNLVNHYAAYLVLHGNNYIESFAPSQLQSLSLFFMNMHRIGYLIAGAFFGVHLVLLGYLLIKSDLFPTLMGWLVVIAGAGYLIETFGDFLLPGNEALFAWIVGVSAAVGEVTLCLYLLIKGIRKNTRSTLSKEQGRAV